MTPPSGDYHIKNKASGRYLCSRDGDQLTTFVQAKKHVGELGPEFSFNLSKGEGDLYVISANNTGANIGSPSNDDGGESDTDAQSSIMEPNDASPSRSPSPGPGAGPTPNTGTNTNALNLSFSFSFKQGNNELYNISFQLSGDGSTPNINIQQGHAIPSAGISSGRLPVFHEARVDVPSSLSAREPLAGSSAKGGLPRETSEDRLQKPPNRGGHTFHGIPLNHENVIIGSSLPWTIGEQRFKIMDSSPGVWKVRLLGENRFWSDDPHNTSTWLPVTVKTNRNDDSLDWYFICA